ncbi:hypothetical protein V2J09_015446 [Rumex salicifolius]
MCGVPGKQSAGEKSSDVICNCNNGGNTKKPLSLPLQDSKLINLDHGDPKMMEAYWKKKGEKWSITIKAWEMVSYFSDPGNVCWFLQPELGEAVRRVHRMVGNAVVDGRYVVVGTGSSQLYQAALYALSCAEAAQPLSVVSAVPYYSSYPDLTDFLKSGLYKWEGDANTYTIKEDEEAFIEVVCSPNNPCGSIRTPAAGVNNNIKSQKAIRKLLIHDLAYYWPHYTPITSPADHDIMLFTVSKCTGHAGSRIGWALVKDEAVARKMVKFIELSTIGTSKEAQMRAAMILNSICDDYLDFMSPDSEGFFEFGYRVMTERWEKLRDTLKNKATAAFTLLDYPEMYCQFMGKYTRSSPAFAWMECKKAEDGAALLREHKVLTRSGLRFGEDKKNVRVSMLDTDENFNVFLQRLSGV